MYVQLEGDSPMVEELRGAVWTCSGLRLCRDTALVTMAQVLVACFDFLSHLVVIGGVSVQDLFVWWCPFRHILYQITSSSYMS
jgi:hypothetical protein